MPDHAFQFADIEPSDYPDPRQCAWRWHAKRLLDVTLALIALAGAGPIIALAALALWTETGRPVFFRQPRIGLNGETFLMYKLRSMHLNHGPTTAADGSLLKVRDDPRITRVGRVLRRSSIDELPQLLNVLMGQMSMVGPRPLLSQMLSPYPELSSVRNRLRPGITGLWQIRDRANATGARFMAEHDLEYIRRFSLRLDAKILACTIFRVLSAKGAY